MADETNNAALQKARKLIVAKRYDEARVLLRTLDDPKAKSWLAQLDKIAPEKAPPQQEAPKEQKTAPSAEAIDTLLEPEYKRSANIPTRPGQLFRSTWLRIAVILLGGLPLLIVAVLLGWNWRRLEKPQWVWGSIAAVLLPFGLLFGVLLSATALKMSRITSTGLIVGAVVLIIYDFFAIYALQNGAYDVWKSGGRKALLAHKYPLEQTALIGLVLVALATVGSSAYTLIQARPKTFDNMDLSLVYSADWQLEDTAQASICSEPDLTCEVILSKPAPAGPAVLVTRFTVHNGITAQALAQGLYDSLPSANLQGKLTRRQPGTQVIAGQTAATLEYSLTDASNPSANDAVNDFEEFFFIFGDKVFNFRVASSRCVSCTPAYRDDVNALFAGLKFKNV